MAHDYEIWFETCGTAHAIISLLHRDGCIEYEDVVEVEMEIYTDKAEPSNGYGGAFDVEDVRIEAFGREYHFGFDDLVEVMDPEEGNEDSLMSALYDAYHTEMDERRAEAYID